MGNKTITAGTLIDLLKRKYADDVFVEECYVGLNGGYNGRMDAWAMKKRWGKATALAFEVKVNRQDFLRDDKWINYLPYCTNFYFVVPPKLILPDEVPEQAGLMVSSVNGTRLFVKKKAPRREVNIPEQLYRHILYSRTKVCDNTTLTGAEYWRYWLEDKEAKHRLGYEVSKRIGDLVTEINQEKRDALDEVKKYEGFKKTLCSMGLDPDDLTKFTFKNQVRELLGALPTSFEYDINRLMDGLSSLKVFIEKQNAKANQPNSGVRQNDGAASG